MTRPKVAFAWLRQLLLDRGFKEVIVPKSHVRFYHERSGTEIILPVYRANQIVMPHHLLTVRFILDAKGLVDEEDFDDLVGSASAKQSAS
jgi:hypothetical protein